MDYMQMRLIMNLVNLVKTVMTIRKKCKRFLDTKWVVPKYLQAQIIEAVIKESC